MKVEEVVKGQLVELNCAPTTAVGDAFILVAKRALCWS